MTSWASGRVTMPRTARLVVCGLSEVIAIFSPTIALSRVDLPAFGRPTKQAKPAWCTGAAAATGGPGRLPASRLGPGQHRTVSCGGDQYGGAEVGGRGRRCRVELAGPPTTASASSACAPDDTAAATAACAAVKVSDGSVDGGRRVGAAVVIPHRSALRRTGPARAPLARVTNLASSASSVAGIGVVRCSHLATFRSSAPMAVRAGPPSAAVGRGSSDARWSPLWFWLSWYWLTLPAGWSAVAAGLGGLALLGRSIRVATGLCRACRSCGRTCRSSPPAPRCCRRHRRGPDRS